MLLNAEKMTVAMIEVVVVVVVVTGQEEVVVPVEEEVLMVIPSFDEFSSFEEC